MAKFTLTSMHKMDFALVEKDDKGEVLFSKTVEFYGGKSFPNFEGGSYFTEDPREIRLLMEHPWKDKVFVVDPDYPDNRELLKGNIPQLKPVEKEPEKPVEEESEKPVEEEVNPVEQEVPKVLPLLEDRESGDSADDEPVDEKEITEVPEVKTVQEGAQYVRKLDPTIKVVDVRTKAAVQSAAAKLNVSFPNL